MKDAKKTLKDNNILFQVKMDKRGNEHLVIHHNGKKADFWPSQNKFNIRGDKEYHSGIRALIKMINV